MLKDFKAFILRGNVVDLAVGLIIGVAFANVITSLVRDIFTPFLAVFGDTNFDQLSFGVGGGEVMYGNFLNNVIAFLLLAAAVFFFVVKPVNALMARSRTEPDVQTTTAECPFCLSNIPESARVCAFCTRDVAGPARSARAATAPARRARTATAGTLEAPPAPEPPPPPPPPPPPAPRRRRAAAPTEQAPGPSAPSKRRRAPRAEE